MYALYEHGIAPPGEHWYTFTFGYGHRLRATNRDGTTVGKGVGISLGHRFVRVPGRDENEARARMAYLFGNMWAMVYRSDEEAGVEAFGLTELALPADALIEAAAAVRVKTDGALTTWPWPMTSSDNPCAQADTCVRSPSCAQYHDPRSACSRLSTEE